MSSAAPVAAALASGTASESTLSYLYGGSAADGVSELSMAIPVYEAIGKVQFRQAILPLGLHPFGLKCLKTWSVLAACGCIFDWGLQHAALRFQA